MGGPTGTPRAASIRRQRAGLTIVFKTVAATVQRHDGAKYTSSGIGKPRAIDLVYNRLIDFYLEQPASAALRNAYLQQAVALARVRPGGQVLRQHRHRPQARPTWAGRCRPVKTRVHRRAVAYSRVSR